MTKAEKNISDMKYEEAVAELDKLVTQLEEGQLPLEETLKLYERGQQLARLCAELLDKAELRIRTLAAEKLKGKSDLLNG